MFVVFSVFLLFRGHDAPGGGFTGGLVASAGFVLYGLAHGARSVRRAIRANLKVLVGAGLVIGLVSALIAPLMGRSFFAAVWWKPPIGPKIGTPAIFDVGVYLVVIGVVLTIMLARDDQEDAEK